MSAWHPPVHVGAGGEARGWAIIGLRAGLAMLGTLTAVSGCNSSSKPGDPVPVEIVQAPIGFAPDSLLLSVQPFPDVDRNGWPDVVPVLVHLFARDSAQPRTFDGGFEFSIYDMQQVLLQRWVVNPGDSPKAAAVRAGLTGYSFRLDIPPSADGSPFPDQVHVEAAFVPLNGGATIASRVLIPFRLK